MEQLPGFGLRIVLVEVREKGSVRKVLETRGIVAHTVQGSWDIAVDLAVTVKPLMSALVGTQVGYRT